MDVTPSAHRLSSSLRDIGYDLNTALADLVDNAIAADATTVEIEVVFEGRDSYLVVADDGCGMTEAELNEALRFGSRRDYAQGELGRYGLGLKTASLSQGRRLTTVSRRAPVNRCITARTLDLDHIERADRWEVHDPGQSRAVEVADLWLDDQPGTVVVIENLDRILPRRNPEGGWTRRRLEGLAQRAAPYLGMVFHRFIEREFGAPLTIVVNGEKVEPWNPFAPGEAREALPRRRFEVEDGDTVGVVWLTPYVLPPRNAFSSPEEFDRLSGPAKWNRQQGLYIYRAGRMIQSGGWSGLRAADEHTKLARAALEFDTDLDDAFRINVAKMRVNLPGQLRSLLARTVQEVCNRANAAYRRDQIITARRRQPPRGDGTSLDPSSTREMAGAIMAAAAAAGEFEALTRIMDSLRHEAPDIADALGW